MTGYLRRLAERTLRVAPPVHSTAGRAYTPMPAATEVELSLDAKPLSPAVPASATPPDRDTMSSSAIRPNSELRRPEPYEIAVRLNPSSGDHAEDETTGRSPQERLSVQPVPVEAVHPRVPPQSEQERDDEFVPLVKAATALDPTVHQAVGSPIDVRPLSPSRPHAYSPVARGPSDIGVNTPAPDTNEVHVTIGRIEITAVHVPPPSKPAPTPAKKPMSLDEYLAKRNGRRS